MLSLGAPEVPNVLPLTTRMAAPPAPSTERIQDLLLRENHITREQLERALREGKSNNLSVTYNLIKTGAIEELDLVKILARVSRMPAVDLSRFEVDARIIKLVSSDIATKHLVLPLKRDGRTLTVAIADPTNLGILEDLKFITRYDIFPVLAGEVTLRSVIEKQYDAGDAGMANLLDDPYPAVRYRAGHSLAVQPDRSAPDPALGACPPAHHAPVQNQRPLYWPAGRSSAPAAA